MDEKNCKNCGYGHVSCPVVPCGNCGKMNDYAEWKPYTNGDKLRSQSNEKLASWFADILGSREAYNALLAFLNAPATVKE